MALRVPQVGSKPVRKQPIRQNQDALSNNLAATDTQSKNPTEDGIAKKEECARILEMGYVQSFVDFFYLIHRPSVKKDDNSTTTAKEMTAPQIAFVKEHLIKAEQSRREGDVMQVYESYEKLAFHYMQLNDLRTAIFFYEKCLEVGKIAHNREFEMIALENLGNAYFGLKDYDQAKFKQESHLEIVKELQNDTQKKQALTELSKVYQQVANQHENQHHYQDAITTYEKLLSCTEVAIDPKSTALAHSRIGCCYNTMSKPSDALPHLKEFLTMCKDINDQQGECQAYAALATSYEILNCLDEAMEYLQQYLLLAEKIENVAAQAEACRRLGNLFSAQNDNQSALEMLERNFELIKSNGDKRLLNEARICLGVARMHYKFPMYMNYIQNDLKGLLDWKSSRIISTSFK